MITELLLSIISAYWANVRGFGIFSVSLLVLCAFVYSISKIAHCIHDCWSKVYEEEL